MLDGKRGATTPRLARVASVASVASIVSVGILTAAAPSAFAQVHWDVGAEVGVATRLRTGGDSAAPGPEPGVVGELQAHVALLPMLRAGPYLSHDIAPVSGRPAHEMTAAGLTVKLAPPLLGGPWRIWAFAGVGYVRAYAPSYAATAPGAAGAAGEATPSIQTDLPGAGGGFLELPFGFGAGYRLERGAWLFAELGGRPGLLFHGSLYDRARSTCSGSSVTPVGAPCPPFLGQDSFAFSVSVGVSLDR